MGEHKVAWGLVWFFPVIPVESKYHCGKVRTPTPRCKCQLCDTTQIITPDRRNVRLWLRHYRPAKSRGVYRWLIEIWVSVSTDWKQYILGVTYQLSAWVELTQVLPVLCSFVSLNDSFVWTYKRKRSTWVTCKDTTGFKFWRMGKILILKGKARETE